MALVLKIKHKETLRRWVVSQTLSEKSSDFSLTVHELQSKVRELFSLAVDDALLITYVDKEGDVITVADDLDLVDACIVQGLNPLRLEVKVHGQKSSAESVANIHWHGRSSSVHESSNSIDLGNTSLTPPNAKDNGNHERPSKHAFPQATADAIKQFVERYTKSLDPNLHPAILIKNIQKALKDFAKTIAHEGQRLAPRRGPAYARCASEPPVRSSVENQNQIVHHGVKCDGCNLYPIQGLRYKSTKVSNYDLCSTCFQKMGDVSDYQTIEKPVQMTCHSFIHPSPTDGKTSSVPMKWTTPFVSGSEGWKSECPFIRTRSGHPTDLSKQFDASFVKELSACDAAELAPCVHFTRILRLKNTGSLSWPQGTALVHIGGDMFALESAINLKLPETGLAVGLEFDVCVDMRAPEKCGNYISHWCLMAPNGERFGQSFWIAIQVVGEMKRPHEAQAACKTNNIGQAAEETSKTQSEVEIDPVPKIDYSCSVTLSKGSVGSDKVDEGSAESPQFIVSGFMDSEGSVTDELDGFSMIEKPVHAGSFKMALAPLVTSQVADPQPMNVIQEQYANTSPLEKTRLEVNLHNLRLMGFANRDLNVILLEKNKQDLQLTLDDLLLGSGWDNLLKDLEEMGFDDANTNLRLLIKNEGSIKRVVKELVELEKLKAEV